MSGGILVEKKRMDRPRPEAQAKSTDRPTLRVCPLCQGSFEGEELDCHLKQSHSVSIEGATELMRMLKMASFSGVGHVGSSMVKSSVVIKGEEKGTGSGVGSQDIPTYIDLTQKSPSASPAKKKCAVAMSQNPPPTQRRLVLPSLHTDSGVESSVWLKEDTDSGDDSDCQILGVDLQEDCYKGDEQIFPVVSRENRGLSTNDVFSYVLLDNKYPCCPDGMRPAGVEESATFVVNIEKVRNILDIRADDAGVWVHGGIPKTNHKVRIVDDDVFVQTVSKTVDLHEEGVYVLQRLYNRHAEEETFKRIIYIVYQNGRWLNRVVIQYYFSDGLQKPINKAPHGNAKGSSQPHLRTQKSTLENLKKKVHTQSVKEAVFDEMNEVGGVLGARSMAEEPRNRRQGYNLKASVKNKELVKTCEPTGDVYELSKLIQEHRSRPDKGFVRDFIVGDGNSLVLGTQQQLKDVERFCCGKNGPFCPLGIDGTFDFGPFFITLTTHRHLLLQKKDGSSPVSIGPIYLHQKRNTESYYDFFRSLFKLRSGLNRLKAMGCDGENALINAIIAAFPDVIILRCFWHVKNNIKDKLRRKFGVNDSSLKSLMNDIFGYHIEGTHFLGLIDAEDVEDFDRKFSRLETKWENEVPGFHRWFRDHKCGCFKEGMIASVREAAGLGSPPSLYTNNQNEGMNSVLRRLTTPGKKLSWTQMVGLLEKLVNQQQVEFERAIYGAGEFRLVPELASYQKSPVEWHKMSQEQKKKCLQKFNSMDCPLSVHEVPQESPDSGDDSEEQQQKLSISSAATGITSVNQSTLDDIWSKANRIMQIPNAITPAPGENPDARCVVSLHGSVPNFVVREGSRFKCTCDLYKSLSTFCHHSLSVAESFGSLATFLAYIKKNQKPANLDKLLSSTEPKAAGRKPGTKTGKKRKTTVETVEQVDVLQHPRQATAAATGYTDERLTEYYQGQPFQLTFMAGLIKKCYGCNRQFSDQHRQPPHDLILKKLDYRHYISPTTGELCKTANMQNTYYHLKRECVRRKYPLFETRHLIVHDDMESKLSPNHKALLSEFLGV